MLVLYVLILRKWLLDKTKFLLPRRKSYQYLDISSYDLKMHCCQSFYWGWTIGWAKSIIWRAQLAKWLLHFHCWKGHETSWDVAALDNFSWRKRTTMTWVHSVDLHFSFVHGGKNCLEYHPPLEGRLQYRTMRNSFTDEKQRGLLCLPAVDYQSTCIWLFLPLVLSLHAIKWLYGDGSISKETTLEHFDSNICPTLENSSVQLLAHVLRMNSSHSTI